MAIIASRAIRPHFLGCSLEGLASNHANNFIRAGPPPLDIACNLALADDHNAVSDLESLRHYMGNYYNAYALGGNPLDHSQAAPRLFNA